MLAHHGEQEWKSFNNAVQIYITGIQIFFLFMNFKALRTLIIISAHINYLAAVSLHFNEENKPVRCSLFSHFPAKIIIIIYFHHTRVRVKKTYKQWHLFPYFYSIADITYEKSGRGILFPGPDYVVSMIEYRKQGKPCHDLKAQAESEVGKLATGRNPLLPSQKFRINFHELSRLIQIFDQS